MRQKLEVITFFARNTIIRKENKAVILCKWQLIDTAIRANSRMRMLPYFLRRVT